MVRTGPRRGTAAPFLAQGFHADFMYIYIYLFFYFFLGVSRNFKFEKERKKGRRTRQDHFILFC